MAPTDGLSFVGPRSFQLRANSVRASRRMCSIVLKIVKPTRGHSFDRSVVSVLNIKRVAQRAVQLGAFSGAEMTNRIAREQAHRKRHDIVASYRTHFGQSFFAANFDLRANPSKRSRNRSARHCRENLDGGISRQYADWSPTRSASQIGPNYVAPGYQLGIVSLAKRAATSTTIGSCGVNRYDAWSSASDLRSSSASRTATAPRRRSSDRLVPRSAASRSSRATRSSSNCTNTSRRPMKHMITHMALALPFPHRGECEPGEGVLIEVGENRFESAFGDVISP